MDGRLKGHRWFLLWSLMGLHLHFIVKYHSFKWLFTKCHSSCCDDGDSDQHVKWGQCQIWATFIPAEFFFWVLRIWAPISPLVTKQGLINESQPMVLINRKINLFNQPALPLSHPTHPPLERLQSDRPDSEIGDCFAKVTVTDPRVNQRLPRLPQETLRNQEVLRQNARRVAVTVTDTSSRFKDNTTACDTFTLPTSICLIFSKTSNDLYDFWLKEQTGRRAEQWELQWKSAVETN